MGGSAVPTSLERFKNDFCRPRELLALLECPAGFFPSLTWVFKGLSHLRKGVLGEQES